MSERWNRLLLALLLLGHLFLLSTSPKTRGGPFERWILGLFGPVAGATAATSSGISSFFDSVKWVGTLRQENEELRQKLEEAQYEMARLHGIEEELDRLARLTSYTRAAGEVSFVADVVFSDPRSWLRTLVIHTGKERAERNQPVVTDQGLVGRVLGSSGGYAKVLLLIDRSASASAMIQRTRRQGLARGAGTSGLLLDNIPSRSDVRIGDRVVTAGLDGVFPRGLPIGVVTRVEPTQALFHRIEVEPAVDLGLLDQVYILPHEPLPASVRGELLDEEASADGNRP